MPLRNLEITYTKRSVSFPSDLLAGVHLITIEDRHTNFSRVVQIALEDLLERRYGRNWHERIADAVRERR